MIVILSYGGNVIVGVYESLKEWIYAELGPLDHKVNSKLNILLKNQKKKISGVGADMDYFLEGSYYHNDEKSSYYQFIIDEEVVQLIPREIEIIKEWRIE